MKNFIASQLRINKIRTSITGLMLSMLLIGCSSTSEDVIPEDDVVDFEAPNQAIGTDLAQRFNEIEIIDWVEHDGYHVARLFAGEKLKSTMTEQDTISVWYKPSGDCELVNIRYNEIPQNIKEIVKTADLYDANAEIVDASFCERPQGLCYKVVLLLKGEYNDAFTVFCSETEVISETLQMDAPDDFKGYPEIAPNAEMENYLDGKYPKALILQMYVEDTYPEEKGLFVADCLVDDIIVSIEYDMDGKKFSEFSILKFSQLSEEFKAKLLALDPNLNDDNCEIERVLQNNETKYWVDASGSVSGQYDENGDRLN